ncbi:MAG: methionine synthase [Prevotella sp.]|nr:methionine synthase [Prevotella sp.]
MTHKILTYDALGIALSDIYEQMGYRGQLPDDATQQETQAVADEVCSWLQPAFCYFVVPRQPDFDMGRIILRQLRDAEAYALFVCTSGAAFEAYQQRLKEQGDMVRVFIADALGSVIAEKCADRMEQHLQASIDKLGWHHTNRFSPGYCGWHVSQQQRLFPLFGGQTCGVSLTDSSLMVPIKSVSGIIGLGKKVRKQDYTCGLCDFKQCYKRRLRP